METETRRDAITMLQIATTVSVVLLALLMMTIDQPMKLGGFRVLPVLIGITGLAFTSVGLFTMNAFRHEWSQSHQHEDRDTDVSGSEFLPLLFEIGLWAIAVLYIFRLIEIARG